MKKAKVVKDLCIGCGACTGICPEVFSFDDDGKAVAAEVPAGAEAAVDEAAAGCPVQAIEVED
jgi:ferredoxin